MILTSCSEDTSLQESPEIEEIFGESDEEFVIFDGRRGDSDGKFGKVSSFDNEILENWTDVLLEVERYAGGMRPNASARALAYIYLTAYETAIPGMRDYETMADKFQQLRIGRPRNTNIQWELALNSSLAEAIDYFLINVPDNLTAKIEEVKEENSDILSDGLSDREIRNSERWGRHVAEQVIKYSLTDSEALVQVSDPQPTSYVPPTGPGFWTFSADEERGLFPYWESVRTFIVSPDETTTIAPMEYSEDPNSPYYQQMVEVMETNNRARAEQADELHIAEFWSDDVEGLMMSPPARQVSILNQLASQHELDLQESLAQFLKLGFALNDAAVATWKYKYEHMVMRPSVFIKEFLDPNYQTNLYKFIYWPNPTFPGYPSGHSCFASAAAGVFIDFFGDNTQFTDRTHEGRTEFLSDPRTFSSLSEMAKENAYSRIPLGVHIEIDCTEGLRLGYEISDGINDFDLTRNQL